MSFLLVHLLGRRALETAMQTCRRCQHTGPNDDDEEEVEAGDS